MSFIVSVSIPSVFHSLLTCEVSSWLYINEKTATEQINPLPVPCELRQFITVKHKPLHEIWLQAFSLDALLSNSWWGWLQAFNSFSWAKRTHTSSSHFWPTAIHWPHELLTNSWLPFLLNFYLKVSQPILKNFARPSKLWKRVNYSKLWHRRGWKRRFWDGETQFSKSGITGWNPVSESTMCREFHFLITYTSWIHIC